VSSWNELLARPRMEGSRSRQAEKDGEDQMTEGGGQALSFYQLLGLGRGATSAQIV
jgi:hypothetical protein